MYVRHEDLISPVFASRLPQDDCAFLQQWKTHLPPDDKLVKIGRRLQRMAERKQCRLDDLTWWSIEYSKQRHLFARLTRSDGERVRLLFLWKSSKDAVPADKRIFLPQFGSWARDFHSPPEGQPGHADEGGWRFELQAEGYRTLKRLFNALLELKTLPSKDTSSEEERRLSIPPSETAGRTAPRARSKRAAPGAVAVAAA